MFIILKVGNFSQVHPKLGEMIQSVIDTKASANLWRAAGSKQDFSCTLYNNGALWHKSIIVQSPSSWSTQLAIY